MPISEVGWGLQNQPPAHSTCCDFTLKEHISLEALIESGSEQNLICPEAVKQFNLPKKCFPFRCLSILALLPGDCASLDVVVDVTIPRCTVPPAPLSRNAAPLQVSTSLSGSLL